MNKKGGFPKQTPEGHATGIKSRRRNHPAQFAEKINPPCEDATTGSGGTGDKGSIDQTQDDRIRNHQSRSRQKVLPTD
jgi:hypothetical protein